MKLRLCLLAFVVLAPLARGASADDFSDRCQTYLQRIADRNQPADFAIVTARIKTGRHVDEALAQLDSLLNNPSGDMFYMYASMGCLLNCRDKLSPAVQNKFRKVWKTYTFYRGDTENHFLMYYAGLMLATEQWPGLAGAEWFNGKSSDENRKEAREYLLAWTMDVARYGLVEFDSPRYFYYQITPLMLLHDFSRNAMLKKRAELTLDYLFTDFASEYLAGSYCGAHSRDAESSTIAPRTAEAMSYAGLYFGDVDVERPLQDLAFAALSPFRLPEIIRAVALDKPQSLVHTESRRGRPHIRFGEDADSVVMKYDFMTNTFCLGSMQGGIAQPIQQRSWSLVFKSRKPNNRVFALHPTYSARELGTFFPEELGLLVGDIGKSKSGYASADKWIGGSFSERIVQEKNALIALYNIPADDPVDHIDYFIPSALDSIQRDSTGWIFLAEGSSYAAIFPLRPCKWIPEGNHIRMRSTNRKNGYVVVAGSATLKPQIKTFSAFKSEIRNGKLDTSAFKSKLEVRFQFGNRTALRAAFAEPALCDTELIADSEFSYLRSHLSAAPHVFSSRGSGIIKISRPEEVMELDFNENVIRRKTETSDR